MKVTTAIELDVTVYKGDQLVGTNDSQFFVNISEFSRLLAGLAWLEMPS